MIAYASKNLASVDGQYLCGICGWSLPKSPKRLRTREHLGQRGDLRRCFANPDKDLIVWAHAECNSMRGSIVGFKLERMQMWATLSLHPAIRQSFPSRKLTRRQQMPGRRIKPGQAAWR